MSDGMKTNLSRVNEASRVCCGARARAASVPSRTRCSAWSKLRTRLAAPSARSTCTSLGCSMVGAKPQRAA